MHFLPTRPHCKALWQSEALKGLEAALDVDPEIQARTPADEGEAAGLDFVGGSRSEDMKVYP